MRVILELGLQRHERVDGLPCQLVGGADDGGLRDALVQDERGLDLRSRETVTRDVDDV